jgi:ferredoxin
MARPTSFLIAFVTMDAVHVSIDTTRCQGHGRCAIIAPDVFDVDDSGKGKVLVDLCPGKFRAAANEAEFSCPETAITVGPLSDDPILVLARVPSWRRRTPAEAHR